MVLIIYKQTFKGSVATGLFIVMLYYEKFQAHRNLERVLRCRLLHPLPGIRPRAPLYPASVHVPDFYFDASRGQLPTAGPAHAHARLPVVPPARHPLETRALCGLPVDFSFAIRVRGQRNAQIVRVPFDEL